MACRGTRLSRGPVRLSDAKRSLYTVLPVLRSDHEEVVMSRGRQGDGQGMWIRDPPSTRRLGWHEASSTLGNPPPGLCRPAGARISISCRPGAYAAGTLPGNFLPVFRA
jgi:hypothetical protein